MGAIVKAVGAILGFFLGRLSWQAPPWLRPILAWRREHRVMVNRAVVTLLLVGGVTVALQHYLESRPKPLRYVASAVAPKVTPIIDGEPRPQPVSVRFEALLDSPGLRQQYAGGAPDVARLELIGTTLDKGVTLTPPMAGAWRWQDGNTLQFEPQQDWPPGRQYSVTFAPEVFAPQVALTQPSAVFTTAPLSITLKDFRFYQDPVDKQVRKTVATLVFSHPVDTESLDQHLSLAARPSGTGVDTKAPAYPRSIRLDEQQREAYVHSAAVSPGEQEGYMTLRVAAGVASRLGGEASRQTIDNTVKIPSRHTFFRVAASQATIARNAEDEPEQALIVNLTDFVRHDAVVAATQAWLLPRRPTGERWHGPREVTEEILGTAEPVALNAMATERDSAQSHSFLIDVPEGRDLYVRLARGLTSDGGYEMATPYDTVVATPDYPKEARVMAEGALLARSGERRLSLQTRGIEAVRYTVGRVLAQDLNHLISQTGGDIKDPAFYNLEFNEDNLSERFEGLLALNSPHPRRATYASLDLAPYLSASSSPLGLFLVRIEGWDRETDTAIPGTMDRRLVLVTDLGLLVKDNVDSTHDLFVQSVTEGLPVAGAEVALLGKNGVPILEGTTSDDGHVRLAETRGFERERLPTVYRVSHGGDVSFIPFERGPRFLNYSRFDVGGLQARYQRDDQLTAYLFTDRGIYRPGESGHVGVVVRRLDLGTPGAIPLLAVVSDPQGQAVVERRLTLDTGGFVELAFATEQTARTGVYEAAVFILGDDGDRQLLGATPFRVEEFQPDRMRIRTRFGAPVPNGWWHGGDLAAEVSLQNLFGAPAQDRRIEAELTLSPSGFRFDDYADYTFIDPYLDPAKPVRQVREKLPTQRSGADGKAAFALDLQRYEQGTYRLTFSAQGYESGEGRSVSAATGLLMSPARRLIGYKVDGDLGYLKRGGRRTVEFIAVDPSLARVGYADLTLRLVERRQVSTLVQQSDGTYRFQSVLKRTTLREQPFAIAAQEAARFDLPTDNPGDFDLELVGDDARVVSRLAFGVVGAGNIAGDLEKNAELAIKLDRKDYQAGDEIELAITAPYHGAGLITIERDRVYAFQWFKTATTGSVQHIRIPDDLEGNAYVTVAFVRAADSREIFTSPLSYGVAPFSIDRARRQLAVTLDAPERIEPGDGLTIGYSTPRPSRLVVFAVDEGILQVAGYRDPDPIGHFLQKRALEVATAQIVDLILPEFALLQAVSAAGGDEGRQRLALGANLNPFARKADAPIAFWSGILEADAQPREQHFDIPDRFSGELRLIAVAVGADAMGVASRRTQVRGPFVLQPNLPTAVAPGDEFDVTLGVANALEGSGADAEIAVDVLPGEGLEVVGDARHRVKIAEGGEARVEFRVRALDVLGPATLRFRAAAGDRQAQITSGMSVRPAVPYRTSLTAGFAEDGRVSLELPRTLYPDLGHNEATASVRPLALIAGLETYLEHYPHACTEQVVSRAYPALARLAETDDPDGRAARLDRLAEAVATLRTRQSSEGGLGLWPGDGRPSAFASVYTAQFLTDAAERDVAIPRAMRERLFDYLRGLAADPPRSLDDARLKARAQYLLARNGEVTTNMLVQLHETLDKTLAGKWETDIVAAYMASTYALLKRDADAERLIRGYKIGRAFERLRGDDVGAAADYASRLAHDAQFVYLIARHFPRRLAEIDSAQVLALVDPIFRGDYNTVSAAAAVTALDAYAATAAALAGDDGVGFTAVDAAGGERPLAAVSRPFPRAEVPIDARAVRIDGAQRLYYLASQAGFDRDPPTDEVREKLEISRQYLDERGEPVTSARQGDELTVRIRVRATAGPLRNAAVVDLLPGGFEVQRDSVKREFGDWSADYIDVREDRVVIYGGLGSQATELSYKVKATARGRFVVPPPMVEAMYDRTAVARGAAARFEVTAAR